MIRKKFLAVSVNLGNVLTPTQVKDAPTVEWDAEADAFYTLCMTDPDAVSFLRFKWYNFVIFVCWLWELTLVCGGEFEAIFRYGTQNHELLTWLICLFICFGFKILILDLNSMSLIVKYFHSLNLYPEGT